MLIICLQLSLLALHSCTSSPTSAIMDLFDNHYQELIHLLPMNNETFLTELREHYLLSDDMNTKMESLTASERASYFLVSVIKPELQDNNVLNFHKLLNIMRKSKLEKVKELSIKIKSEYAYVCVKIIVALSFTIIM